MDIGLCFRLGSTFSALLKRIAQEGTEGHGVVIFSLSEYVF